MGIYKVTAFNTPQFNDKLHAASLEYFPEVHCYLKLSNHRFDFTTHSSNIAKIEGDIILEEEILPFQVVDYKVQQHKTFISKWIVEYAIEKSFEEVWQLREQFIAQLSS